MIILLSIKIHVSCLRTERKHSPRMIGQGRGNSFSSGGGSEETLLLVSLISILRKKIGGLKAPSPPYAPGSAVSVRVNGIICKNEKRKQFTRTRYYLTFLSLHPGSITVSAIVGPGWIGTASVTCLHPCTARCGTSAPVLPLSEVTID